MTSSQKLVQMGEILPKIHLRWLTYKKSFNLGISLLRFETKLNASSFKAKRFKDCYTTLSYKTTSIYNVERWCLYMFATANSDSHSRLKDLK